jgi:putative acetyltransferase
VVRPEAPQDFEAVRQVLERAFAPGLEEAELVDRLRASGVHVPELCLVALDGPEVVGHIAVSRARLSTGVPVLALAPVAVRPEHQRRGAGSALVRAALRRAARTDFGLMVVLGHPAYYPRFGFEPAAPHGVHAPFDVPPEAWMLYRLPALRPGAHGTVVYPEAFAAVT